MTFVNISLLAGTALIALPIILHLVMRRRPTLLEFPALRFIQKRHDTNQKKLQLRHLILLLLRAGAIALLALALARPSIKLAGAIGNQEAPVAAALVFDAAPHMEYRQGNQTRLEAARDLGLWLIAQLPEQSEMAVMDTRLGTTAAFQVDRGAARERIARLETVANSQSLPIALDGAVELLRQSHLERKELYIFTDLARGAWPEQQAIRFRQRLEKLADLGVYVIDVGVLQPIDYGLGDVRLSGDVLSSHSTLAVQTSLSSIGGAEPRVVELLMRDADGKPQKRSEQSCNPSPGELQPIEFHLGGLEPGTHQGFLRIVGQDGLAADDSRYFTVTVKPAWRLLVAAPKPAESYALFLTEALAPDLYRKRGQARFDCDICNLDELAKRPLDAYTAVCLLDPTSREMEPAVWKKLTDYAADGHGVAIFLGRNAVPIDAFNTPEAQELLPGKLLRQARRPDGDLHLAPGSYQHPILAAFRDQAGSIPWDAFPVFRYWEFDEPQAGASMILPFNDGKPAIVEKPVGRGRSITMTTPVSDRPNQNPWNLLPVGEAWPFLILVNQMANYLVGGSDLQLNYLAGQTAVLPLDPTAQHGSYMLSTPSDLSFPVSADLKRGELAITATDQVGNYRLQAGGADGVKLGFSVNYAVEQTQLDRLNNEELTGMFGPVKYRLARTREQIDRDISMGRVGQELFPPLILIVALILGLEMFMANRFYKE
jgi:hypothetical protein